jgi:hypothetical protein
LDDREIPGVSSRRAAHVARSRGIENGGIRAGSAEAALQIIALRDPRCRLRWRSFKEVRAWVDIVVLTAVAKVATTPSIGPRAITHI